MIFIPFSVCQIVYSVPLMMLLEYTPHQQYYIPHTICIIHSKDTINKPSFSTSSTKYRKCKLLDSSTVHQRVH
jgi:hypothetical protein